MDENMRPIGGYFELELQHVSNVPHADGLFVNSGRNALEYILLALNPKKVYIPYFTCDVVLEPFNKHNIPYQFYHINESLELAEDIELKEGEYLLANNYYGIKDNYIQQLAERFQGRMIVDNAQALYAEETQHCFYSPRKFVGIPDSGIVVTDGCLEKELETDYSYDRCSHHLKRYDLGSSAGYGDFRDNSHKLVMQPIFKTSVLTMRLLDSIDFEDVKAKRLKNFKMLDDALGASNRLTISLAPTSVPMVYPYLCKDDNLREELISEQVFVATYWPNVFDWCKESDIEYKFAKYVLPLPCDQRYGEEDMDRIINIVK